MSYYIKPSPVLRDVRFSVLQCSSCCWWVPMSRDFLFGIYRYFFTEIFFRIYPFQKMNDCSVKYCDTTLRWARRNGATFHGFPANSPSRAALIQFCGHDENWQPGPSSQICSLHFEESAFWMSEAAETQPILREDATAEFYSPAGSFRNPLNQPKAQNQNSRAPTHALTKMMSQTREL